MRIDSVSRLRVGIVPSWLAEIVSMTPDLEFSDLLVFHELADTKSSILSKDEVLIYALTQRYLNTFAEDVFSDTIALSNTMENSAFINDHAARMLALEKETLLKDQMAQGKDQLGISGNQDLILDKEFYVPLMQGTETLLLIGSKSAVYEDKRAFLNAVVEAIAGSVSYPDFRHYNFFREYLKYAITKY
ncbi:hypothetical protein [Serratia phage vB_SmaM_Yaphecito]|uniref:Uncharacterized protein n=1 Tax=Serratia phage vB_SmaM_Yaphecito TaxID=2777368 RepID=A0A7T3NBK3_9CAUD|nr:hypothetical protein [Serratia phage vB_SmaM_Yaphecito]